MATEPATTPKQGLRGMAEQANPAFAAAAVAVPILALGYALAVDDLRALNFVHVLAGALWTGIDLFVGFVLGPVLGGLDREERASVFRRLTPKMTFLMPVIAAVTITGGTLYAESLGLLTLWPFAAANHWVLAALTLATLLTINGFGVILPNEVRIYREVVSENPDVDRIGALGMRNAKLGGLQGVMQLGMIVVMVNLV